MSQPRPSPTKLSQFKKTIWAYYKLHKRDFPWRNTTDFYHILVSEIMLQQTQTYRVEPKYLSFIKHFPTLKALARASLHDVLSEWKGLGYNRRAIALHSIAKILTDRSNSSAKGASSRKRDLKQPAQQALPNTPEELQRLPYIGPNTAGSISAFAFNTPVVFIETNIRTVFIHYFFNTTSGNRVHDKDIFPLIEKTLDYKRSREWYYALMDYGAMLKKKGVTPNSRSIHYKKQSPFKGSNREMRSHLLDTIRQKPRGVNELIKLFPGTESALLKNIDNLVKEGFIEKGPQGRVTIKE